MHRAIEEEAATAARVPGRAAGRGGERGELVAVHVEGHPLAGVVRFHADTHGKRVLFEVETITRSGSVMDFVAMKTIGNYLQKLNWIEVVERVVETSGGEAPNGVEHAERKIGEEEARQIEEEISELVRDLRRDVKEAKLEEE